jgi:hypothetical protein
MFCPFGAEELLADKVIKRMSYGYRNVEVYIKKVLTSLIYHTFG